MGDDDDGIADTIETIEAAQDALYVKSEASVPLEERVADAPVRQGQRKRLHNLDQLGTLPGSQLGESTVNALRDDKGQSAILSAGDLALLTSALYDAHIVQEPNQVLDADSLFHTFRVKINDAIEACTAIGQGDGEDSGV